MEKRDYVFSRDEAKEREDSASTLLLSQSMRKNCIKVAHCSNNFVFVPSNEKNCELIKLHQLGCDIITPE